MLTSMISNGKEVNKLAEVSREGHRERMRASYLAGDMDNAPERNLLELFLSVIIPRRDVKELTYALLNTFGSLENVLNATPHELMTVNGIGESTAIEISLVKKLVAKANYDKNQLIKKFDSLEQVYQFCKNLYTDEIVEKVYMVTIKSNHTIINTYKVGEGDALSSCVDTRSILTYAMRDNATYVLVVHNHPNGNVNPSGDDLSFTIRLKEMLESINVYLFDHVIVGDDEAVSLRRSNDYRIKL